MWIEFEPMSIAAIFMNGNRDLDSRSGSRWRRRSPRDRFPGARHRRLGRALEERLQVLRVAASLGFDLGERGAHRVRRIEEELGAREGSRRGGVKNLSIVPVAEALLQPLQPGEDRLPLGSAELGRELDPIAKALAGDPKRVNVFERARL